MNELTAGGVRAIIRKELSSFFRKNSIDVRAIKGDTATTQQVVGSIDGVSSWVTIDSITGLDVHTADPTAAHAASAISVADAGLLLAATDVEAALAEIIGMFATDAPAYATIMKFGVSS